MGPALECLNTDTKSEQILDAFNVLKVFYSTCLLFLTCENPAHTHYITH